MEATPPAATPAPSPALSSYPVNVEFSYPESLSRLTTFFRFLLAVPIMVILYLLGNMIIVATWLMLVFRKKYPSWWFAFQREYTAFTLRVEAYLLMMTDRYPSVDEAQGVELQMEPPGELSRWLPFVKWLLLLPHYVVLAFVAIGAMFAVVIAWFAILFTGRYPRSLFDFVAGTLRWGTRVNAYGFLLVTDRYPPFRLKA